ncbi:twin-arginine translocase TatA/TatE family subunit [Bacteriovoracaceae bacterium]|nr:twin-arginine translocase TatA/TatE family subunit [Bacteriovoracaceae bacterium]
MFGLGLGEILLICVFLLIFIGPKKLPELARGLGKGIREFQRASQDLKQEVMKDTNATSKEEMSPQVVVAESEQTMSPNVLSELKTEQKDKV